jgi:hypothetical protein
MWHVWGDLKGYARLGWENLRERYFGRPMHRWKDNIKIVLQEVGWSHGLA